MENLTSKTLKDIVAYINDKHLKAGDSLPTEQDFLELLSCSRTTLREVLAYLKGLGIVTSRRGSGFKIAHVNVADIIKEIIPLAFSTGGSLDELLELRRCLELGNIELAVINSTQEDIELMEEALKAYDELIEDGETIDYRKLGEVEAKFHSSIQAPAHCTFLDVINISIKEYFDSLLHTPPTPPLTLELLKLSQEQHRALVLCFKVKNPSAAQACLRQHFAGVKLERFI